GLTHMCLPQAPAPRPPPALPPPQETQATHIITIRAMPSHARRAFAREAAKATESRIRRSNQVSNCHRRIPAGGSRRRSPGYVEEGAVVVTVTFTVAGLVPSRVGEFGLIEQLASAGTPEQVKLSVWLKPPAGVTVNEYVALWPRVTAIESCDVVSVKSWTIMERGKEYVWPLRVPTAEKLRAFPPTEERPLTV